MYLMFFSNRAPFSSPRPYSNGKNLFNTKIFFVLKKKNIYQFEPIYVSLVMPIDPKEPFDCVAASFSSSKI